jgi:Protein of unknown function (DUF3017)
MDGPSLPVRRIVFAIVLLLVALSLPVSVLIGFRIGGYLLALAAIFGGTARAVLPDYLCLGLLVRSRQQDVVTLLTLGVAVAVAARIVPAG